MMAAAEKEALVDEIVNFSDPEEDSDDLYNDDFDLDEMDSIGEFGDFDDDDDEF